ncbi:HK97 gp10 family phage protein [Variovorax boronicumulans]|uniref:HK97 gp10 family phage protein n=1 Tax=Variovorax boronicumulans TaxID=436515 RepID=UPI001C55B152
MVIAFEHSGADAALDGMEEAMLALVRPAAQAGAQVLYDEVRARVAPMRKTGNLYTSIYQAYSDQSTPERAVYHISWNARRAPHGHLVEFGHMQTRKVFLTDDGKWRTSKELLAVPRRVAAKPFIRPAYDAKVGAALAAAEAHFAEGMRQILARYSA